jgi:hypothetical protein
VLDEKTSLEIKLSVTTTSGRSSSSGSGFDPSLPYSYRERAHFSTVAGHVDFSRQSSLDLVLPDQPGLVLGPEAEVVMPGPPEVPPGPPSTVTPT